MVESSNKNKARIGDIVEYKAIVWLLSQGYEVYKNVSCRGPIDIIMLDTATGILRKIDVKKVVDGSRRSVKVSHPVKTLLQQSLQIDILYYDEKQDFFAWSTTDIYANMKKVKVDRNIQSCVVFDREFPSITSAAKHYCTNERTAINWLRRNPTGTLEQAITHAISKSKLVNVHGKQYRNKKQACEDIGVSISVVEYWHYEKGLSFEEAIDETKRREEKKEHSVC